MNQTVELAYSNTPITYDHALSFMRNKVFGIIDATDRPTLWFLEHPPLYTAGTSADKQDLLEKNKFPVYESGRGGQYTYHGPGQRIVYTMLNLKEIHGNKPDLRKYIKQLETWVINTLARLGIESEIKEGRVGIWITHPDGKEEKIAAIGIRVQKWISFHGIAINIAPDLNHYSGIIPCGISEHGVTSLEKLGVNISMKEFDQILCEEFPKVFGFDIGRRYEVK